MAMLCLREPLAFQPYRRDAWGLGFAYLPSLPVLHPLPTGAVLGVPSRENCGCQMRNNGFNLQHEMFWLGVRKAM